jgi:hypothetical protein
LLPRNSDPRAGVTRVLVEHVNTEAILKWFKGLIDIIKMHGITPTDI